MAGGKLLIYLLRRDLRVTDNPILHHLATGKEHNFTHLLPIFIFPSHQIEVSGFLTEGAKSPYPQARSQVGGFWRCGTHRARFLAQSVWDVKQSLQGLDSDLLIRVGDPKDVVSHIISTLKDYGAGVSAVWMTEEKSSEEWQEQEDISSVCSDFGIDFQLWPDEKYYVDDRDTGLDHPNDLPDVFTSYRKSQEPLRDRPRSPLPKPQMGALPPLPDSTSIPPQAPPFMAAESLEDLEQRLIAPLGNLFNNPPQLPEGFTSAHPFRGGETSGWERLEHLINSGAMTAYKDTRNGLIGPDFSTKLSAFLANGSLSAREIHRELLHFEDGTASKYEMANGYGNGENEGTRGVRFELLWRDYMRLCTQKFGRKLFRLSGFRDSTYTKTWKSASSNQAGVNQKPSTERISHIIERFLQGTTGMGLIDASQRELFHTGYTSNRARQNVASFFAKHLEIDWRYGAEWYEMLLVDYDVSSNWSNWLYVAGVGNDPRGDARIFNPVKQAFDYDKDGSYVRMWIPEVRGMEKVENVFQAHTASKEDLTKCGIEDHIMVTDPVKRIDFSVDKKPRAPRKSNGKHRGGRGGGNGGRNGGQNGGQSGHDTRGDGRGEGKHNLSSQSVDSTQHSYAGRSNQSQQNRPLGFNGHLNSLSQVPPGFIVPMFYTAPPLGQPGYGDTHWFPAPNQYRSNRGQGYGCNYRGRGGRRGNGQGYSGRNNMYQQYSGYFPTNNHGNNYGGYMATPAYYRTYNPSP